MRVRRLYVRRFSFWEAGESRDNVTQKPSHKAEDELEAGRRRLIIGLGKDKGKLSNTPGS